MDSPKTLIDFMEMYQTEEDCRQALFNHKWPDVDFPQFSGHTVKDSSCCFASNTAGLK